MKASELRIGNLLRDKQSKTTLKVIELNENDIFLYVIDRSLFPLPDGWSAEGIPITQESLVSIGFINVYTDAYEAGRIIVEFNEDNSFMVCIVCSMPWIELDHIEFIDQIQNLYFAIEGEELTLKQ